MLMRTLVLHVAAGTSIADAKMFFHRRKAWALVMADYHLPDGNGWDLCCWVRAQPGDPPPFPIGEEEGPFVEATLWVDHAAVMPGQVFWVGVTFRIRPEWHMYWPGINDTGMAPSFDWHLPDGWQIGRARWPAPKRHVGSAPDHRLRRDQREDIPEVVLTQPLAVMRLELAV